MLHLILLLSSATAPAVAPTAAPDVRLVEDIETWIAKGREQIEAGNLTAARATLEQAAALDGGGDQSTLWLMRLQVAEGDWDAVLGAASRMRRDGKASTDLTYVTGMALAAKTQAALADGDAGSVGFLLEDAKTALAEALEADPERYRDAWMELARVGLLTGDSETSLKAARAVLAARPDIAEAHLLAGRGELSLGAALYSAEEQNPESSAHLERAKADLERALELAGEDVLLAADAAMQLGTTAAYLADDALKQRAYTLALGLAPENNFNVNTIWSTLGHADFQTAAEAALGEYDERMAGSTAGDATLRWWYGWSLFTTADGDEQQLERARAEFTDVLKKAPAFANSHYYLGRIAYDRSDWAGAASAWREFRRYLGTDAATTFAADELDTARLGYVVGQVLGQGDYESAIALTEILTEIEPANPVHWNNLGLFERDFGDRRAASADADDEDEAAAIAALYEDSYRSYNKALELDPENPAYLNDTAVLLHYNLGRDYDKALAMYKAAEKLAQALLEGGELSDEERPIIEIALRDSRNNARKLEKLMQG